MAFNAYICQSRMFRSWLIYSTDQNAEFTRATDVHTVAKLVATVTALKRTTKQHRATTNTEYVITIE